MRAFLWPLRAFLTAVFLLAGTIKLIDPARFQLDIRAFDLLPAAGVYLAALFLPVLEVLAALALWTPLRRGAAALLALLTAGFIGGLFSALARGIEVDCGCFGTWLVFPSIWMHLAFNSLLIVIAGLLLAAERRSSPRRLRFTAGAA
ncbi:MAG: MauE/DoxX family redox-associated membrane protein [Verrucomicrobiota bacterium]